MSQNLRSHVVWSHPRVDSLTAAIVRNTIEQLNDRDIEVDELDLYRYGFDPVLREVDEPDWKDEAKAYSPETEALVERVQRADLFVAIFPLWWYGLPAMLKGYFDRVWNHGRLYGTKQKANARSIVWVAISGLSKSTLAKHGHDTALKAVLSSGIANYCGIGASSLVILADTIDNPDISRYKNEVGKAIDEALDSIRV